MKNENMSAYDIAENITQQDWIVDGSLVYALENSGWQKRNRMSIYVQMNYRNALHEEEGQANALAVAKAVSATYKSGYDPAGIAPVVDALEALLTVLEPLKNNPVSGSLMLYAKSAREAITIKPKNEQ